VIGIIMMILYVILDIYFPYDIVLGKWQVLLTTLVQYRIPHIADMNFIKRMAVLFVAGFVIRARYYFIWITGMFITLTLALL